MICTRWRMIIIESNSATHGMQDRIFILRVLFGLVMMQPSHAGDGSTELVLAVECCHHQNMLVTMLLSHTSNGTAKLVLTVALQGTIADHQGDTIEHQGVIADREHAIPSRQGATANHQRALAGHQGTAIDRQGAAVDR
jgi:hypothetical protein